MAEDTPVILFGAFDRHNFGDLLFAHIAATILKPRPVVFAGLAERDMTAWGGHQVRAIAYLAREWGNARADVVHAGGEILTCSLYEAAVMLLSPEAAQPTLDHHARQPADLDTWAQVQTGLTQQMGYLVPKGLFRRPGRSLYTGVGGANLADLSEARQGEVIARLRQADHLTVRDRVTQTTLASHGIHAELVPDPAVLTGRFFATLIAARQSSGEPRKVRERFPQGYVAVQFSADFGDDASLRILAAQLDEIASRTEMGLVLFRAGAAPWHDDLGIYRRLLGFLRTPQAWVFESLHLWDICALLAGARAYGGSSLHGRIVAESLGVPGVNLIRNEHALQTGKQAAYAATWHREPVPAIAEPGQLASGVLAVLDHDLTGLQAMARCLADLYQESTGTWFAEPA